MELFCSMNLKKKKSELGVNNRDYLRKMMMHHKGFMNNLDGKFMLDGKWYNIFWRTHMGFMLLRKNTHIYGSSKREWEFYKQTWGHWIDFVNELSVIMFIFCSTYWAEYYCGERTFCLCWKSLICDGVCELPKED